MGTSDAERSGRPVEVTTPEIINKIHDMVMDDRRVKVREIASAVGISNERELMNSSMNDGYLEKYNCQRCVNNEERLPNASILSNVKHQHNQYLGFHVEQDIYDLNFNLFYN
uniref:Uncharacterized protein n=1 Tax=Rhodnius prolixus TaxID=13249 RepID=T1HUZ9_RHOPR